ncbi:MAG: transglutaminase domain-containing protein [Clostridia bacterium]|nr:transglutaminase domain-containing protein [Clostridia bacterium]
MKLKRVRKTPEYSVYSHVSKTSVLSCLMQLLLLFFAVLSTVLCVSTSLAMTVSVVEIGFWCLLFTLLFAGVCFNKITTLVSVGVGALGALVFLSPLTSFVKTLEAAVRFCYDLAFVIMKMAGWDYTSNMLTSEEDIAKILDDEMLVLTYFRHVIIVLAFFYALWYVALAWKKPRIWPTIVVSLAVLAPGFIIGLVPSATAFSMLLAVAFGLYMQTLPSRHLNTGTLKEKFKAFFKKQDAQTRFAYTIKSGLYGICSAAVSLILLLLVALVTVRTPLIELDQVREYLDEGYQYVYNQIFYSRLETPDNAIGNMIDGDTVDILKIPKIHKVPVYYLTTEENETVYLRAWVTDLWTDDGWRILDESTDKDYKRVVKEGTDPYTFAYQLQGLFEPDRLDLEEGQSSYGFVTDTISLRARFSKSLVAHLPEFGASGWDKELSDENFIAGEIVNFDGKRPAGNTYTVDSFVPVITSKGYVAALHGLAGKYATLLTVDTSDVESENFQTFLSQERSYKNYATKHFTGTSGMSDVFKDLAHELSDKYETQLAKVLSIEKYFRDSGKFEYTLRPEILLESTPMRQLEHSLIVNNEGYCTYYATAMTLMVRSLGFPARFVNGYYVKTTDKEANGKGQYKRTVMDESCHAWVEVYFDGLGWMNFDPTPDAEETGLEYTSRYYALELEDGSGESDEKGAAAIEQAIEKVDFEEQPDDNEVMPTVVVDYGLFGGNGLRVLTLIILAVVVVLVLAGWIVLLVKANSHATEQYKSVDEPDENGNEAGFNLKGHRMYLLILRWLSLKKLERYADESVADYAERVDKAMGTENSFAALIPILQKCEFADTEIIESQYWQVRLYYDELYRKTHLQKGKLPWWKKIRI